MKLGFYKHDNCTDVAVEVAKSIRRSNGFTIICHWWNVVNPSNHFRIDKYDVCFVSDEQLPNWKEFHVKPAV